MTEGNNTFDRQITVKFNRHLESGEYIVWCGKGYASADKKAYIGTKIYFFVFATIWTSFLVFWAYNMIKSMGWSAILFAIPFIIAGAAMYIKGFKAGREKACFAVTNMRILKVGGYGLEMEYLKNIASVQIKEKGKKADVTYSIEYQGEQNVIVGNGAICGLAPEEAENVRYIIESESAKAHMYS
ncbi:MAG: hypothetical protein IJ035_10870 [Oscillospiraceae bacterium]|nr:hypothetical protein [Oscillospiraceae bacterium]